jgi:tol-pal system protein YbgF
MNRMRALALGAGFLGAWLFCSASPLVIGKAEAQDNRDLRPLLDRLDRMERDMNQLQRQVYRGGSSGGAPVPVTPADSGTAVNIELRLDQLETQMRTMTGSVEEANYSIDQLKRRLDKLVSDIDLRLSQLEHPGAPGAAPSRSPPVASAAPPPPAAPAPGAGANPAAPPSQPGNLVAPSAAGAQTASRTPPAPAPQGGTLPTGSAQDQYNFAFGKLREADYPAAEEALRSFVQRYPNDALAGNAQYWLGETYYVRKDYNNAAATFAEGYRKYPQSGKAADNLLKLGMSLGNIGQKKEACLTFNQLAHDFPKASSNITERAVQERQRLGC